MKTLKQLGYGIAIGATSTLWGLFILNLIYHV